MKKSFLFIAITTIAHQFTFATHESSAANALRTNTNIYSLPTAVQTEIFKHVNLKTKLDLIESDFKHLLAICLDIKIQYALLPENIRKLSDFPELKHINCDPKLDNAKNILNFHSIIREQASLLPDNINTISSDLSELKFIYSDAMKDSFQQILNIYKDIKKLASKLPENISTLTEFPEQQTKLITFYQDIEWALDSIQALTYQGAWDNDEFTFQDVRRILLIKKQVFTALKELSDILDKLKDLLHNCKDQSIYINTDINIDKIHELKETISIVHKANQLIPISKLNLNGLPYCKKENWARFIRALRLFPISQLNLYGIRYPNQEYWVRLIQALPDTVKIINLGYTNIDASALRELHRLNHLEGINLSKVTLSNQEDWDSVIQALPDTVKIINLGYTNIDASALRELHRLNHLEGINLSKVTLSNQEDWDSVIQALPDTVKIINLNSTKINTDALLELNRLNHLEEIQLYYVKLSNIENWVSVIQALPETLKIIGLGHTNIDATGLIELNKFKHLEDINLKHIKLFKLSPWRKVISVLPKTVKNINVSYTNCSDYHIKILKNKGIHVINSDLY